MGTRIGGGGAAPVREYLLEVGVNKSVNLQNFPFLISERNWTLLEAN